jgi:hypothetical protein
MNIQFDILDVLKNSLLTSEKVYMYFIACMIFCTLIKLYMWKYITFIYFHVFCSAHYNYICLLTLNFVEWLGAFFLPLADKLGAFKSPFLFQMPLVQVSGIHILNTFSLSSHMTSVTVAETAKIRFELCQRTRNCVVKDVHN